MKDRQYLKHDASAAVSPKLVVLLDKEGLRGYGIYWLLLELLRQQDQFVASLDMLGGMARRLGTRAAVLQRIVENYGLFIVENGQFFSPGLCRRLEAFAHKLDELGSQCGPQNPCNSLKISDSMRQSARKPDQTKPDQRISLTRDTVGSERIFPDTNLPLLSMDEALDLLRHSELWLEEMAMKSGDSRLFVQCFPALLEEFASFIRLRGEERTVCSETDAKRRFYYWLMSKQGKDFLAARRKTCCAGEEAANPFETVVEGKRMYCGCVIPDEAPPRPNGYVVWNEHSRKWER